MTNENQFMSHVDGILEEYAALLRANAKLEKKIAALQTDAKRYRWLRSYNAFAVTEKDGEGGYTLMGDEYLDAAIDDAMEKKVK
jgi:hypothetical protein